MRLFQVEKGRLAVECPPEITKHLMDIEVIIIFKLWQQYDTLITCIYINVGSVRRVPDTRYPIPNPTR